MFILTSASSVILDLMRFVLIQLVVFGHLNGYFHLTNLLSPPNFPYIQNVAVTGFFLLSGFLIPYSLNQKNKDKNYSFKKYFFDRLIRIYIVVVPAIFITLIIDSLHLYFNQGIYRFINAFNIKTFLVNLFMFQYFPSIPFGSNRPLWVLGLLWWLYLAFGWWWFHHNSWKRRPVYKISILLTFLIIPIISMFQGRGQGLAGVWILGVLTFYLLKNRLLNLLKPALSMLLSGIFFSISLTSLLFIKNEFGLLFASNLALSFLFLLNYFQSHKGQVNTTVKNIIRKLSGYSFSLYLTHYPLVVFLLFLNLSLNPYQYFIFLFLTTNLFAFLIAQITEMKISFIKNKLNFIYHDTIKL